MLWEAPSYLAGLTSFSLCRSLAQSSNQERKSQAEVHHGVTWAGYVLKDACSPALAALVISWILAGSSLCLSGSATPAVSHLISTWTLDRDLYCRHLGKEELLMMITHLSELKADSNTG